MIPLVSQDKSKDEGKQQNIIAEAQQDLGVPNEPHYDRKTPLLMITVGSVTSNLSLREK